MAKRIVITGVSRGLGLAMTQQFIQAGHTVFGCARSPGAIAQLEQKFAGPHRFTALDIADQQQVNSWAGQLLKDSAPPDLLINNAGIINTPAPLWQVPAAEFSRLIDVNINGVMNVIRAFAPAMVAQKSGVIVNFSSGWGRSTSPEVGPYCASKWAIEGLTRSLAQELPRGMAAIPLNPGIIHTEMLDTCFGSAAAAYPEPQDWARKAVPFLLKLGPQDNGNPLTVPA